VERALLRTLSGGLPDTRRRHPIVIRAIATIVQHLPLKLHEFDSPIVGLACGSVVLVSGVSLALAIGLHPAGIDALLRFDEPLRGGTLWSVFCVRLCFRTRQQSRM